MFIAPTRPKTNPHPSPLTPVTPDPIPQTNPYSTCFLSETPLWGGVHATLIVAVWVRTQGKTVTRSSRAKMRRILDRAHERGFRRFAFLLAHFLLAGHTSIEFILLQQYNTISRQLLINTIRKFYQNNRHRIANP